MTSKFFSPFHLPLHDVVCCLLEKPFWTWEEDDQIDLVKTGRPRPTICAGKRKVDEDGKYHFFRNAWYFRYDFLCGSAYMQNIHCWPCLLFADESDRWVCDTNPGGQCDFYLIDEHAKGDVHDACVNKLVEFKKQKCKRIYDTCSNVCDGGPVKVSSSVDVYVNDFVRLNRLCVKYALDAVLFMIKNQMPLVLKEDFGPCGLTDLLNLLVSQSSDEELKSHFRKLKRGLNTILSKAMLQGLVESVSECVQDYIKNAVESALFFSIRVDDGLNESSECALFIRIVNETEQLQEFFIGYYSLNSDKTSLSLFRILDNLLDDFEYKSKLIGICFDTTCVKFNYLKDLRVGMKFMAQQSTNVNLFGHSIDYLLEKCLCSIPTCRLFFANLSALSNLTKILVKRNYCPNSDDWREVCNLKKSCCSKFKLLSAMTQDWTRLILFFQEIQQETVDLEDVYCLVSGIFEKLKDHQFVFLAVFFRHLFQITSNLFEELKAHPFDAKFCQSKVKDVCVTLYQQRNETFYDEMLTHANRIIQIECEDDSVPLPDTCYKSLYFEIIDNIIMELHTRFETTDRHIFFELGDLFHYDSNRPFKLFIRDRVRIVANFFPTFFNKAATMEGELFRMIQYRSFWIKSLLNVIKRMKNLQGPQAPFDEAFKLLRLITLLTPSEETFPCLHEFSAYLKDSDVAMRPHLANILMNQDVLDGLSKKFSFKDDVLNKLAAKYDTIKLSYMVKSKERRPEINLKPTLINELEANALLRPVPESDLVIELDPGILITPDIDPPDLTQPGPSTRMEPDSSVMEHDVDRALTCDIYPADTPQPDSVPKIKKEPIDPDEIRPDILSATVVQELNSFSNESIVTSKEGSLFQPPVLIKEEPISSDDEL